MPNESAPGRASPAPSVAAPSVDPARQPDASGTWPVASGPQVESAPPVETSAPPVADTAPVPATPPAAAPASPSEPLVDPLAALLTVGNRWEYLEIQAWHDNLYGISRFTEEVESSTVVGRYTVAMLRLTGESGAGGLGWIRDGDAIHRLDGFRENDDAPMLDTEPAIREALRQRSGSPMFERARAKPGLGCGAQGCVGALVVERDDEVAALWPGVGFIERGNIGPYSAETGDGMTISALLVRAWLAAPPPSSVVQAEPAAGTVARREALAALVDEDGKGIHTKDYARVRHSLDLETRTYPGFLQALAVHGGGTWSLAQVLADECGLVPGPVELLACPRAHASWSVGTGLGKAPPTSVARAYFRSTEGGRFELAAVFAGGPADVFMGSDDREDTAPLKAWP